MAGVSTQTVSVQSLNAQGANVLLSGGEGFFIDVETVKAMFGGAHRPIEVLIFQLAMTLVQAGVDPRTATGTQIKAALNGSTVEW